MHTCQRVNDLRAQLAPARLANQRIALVATMGNLHEGHMQLIRLAKTLVDVVV
ncbi:MAG TPA: pantoate--beta-alanine ligase, partial [Pseudomonadales bacterium]|nr:pantoate--beta-alanine ligase [Pseudomonadales bacterium]